MQRFIAAAIVLPFFCACIGCASVETTRRADTTLDYSEYEDSLSLAYVLYDGETGKEFPFRIDAVTNALRAFSQSKSSAIVSRYFLVSEHNEDATALKHAFEESGLTNVIAITAINDFYISQLREEELIAYAERHWPLAPKNIAIDLLTNAALIFPDRAAIRATSAVGHAAIRASKSGAFQGMPLFVQWKDYLIPSLALLLAADARGISIKDAQFQPDGENIRITFGPNASVTVDKTLCLPILMPMEREFYRTITIAELPAFLRSRIMHPKTYILADALEETDIEVINGTWRNSSEILAYTRDAIVRDMKRAAGEPILIR